MFVHGGVLSRLLPATGPLHLLFTAYSAFLGAWMALSSTALICPGHLWPLTPVAHALNSHVSHFFHSFASVKNVHHSLPFYDVFLPDTIETESPLVPGLDSEARRVSITESAKICEENGFIKRWINLAVTYQFDRILCNIQSPFFSKPSCMPYY